MGLFLEAVISSVKFECGMQCYFFQQEASLLGAGQRRIAFLILSLPLFFFSDWKVVLIVRSGENIKKSKDMTKAYFPLIHMFGY